MCKRTNARGVTIIELIIAMVITSIAVTGVLLAFTTSITHSADPMIDAQALAIAEAYMDEILAKPVAGGSGCNPNDEFSRPTCASVTDYGSASQEPMDQLGDSIEDLSDYRVTVSVGAGAVALGADAIGTGDATVTVTVTRGTRSLTLRGYKVDY